MSRLLFFLFTTRLVLPSFIETVQKEAKAGKHSLHPCASFLCASFLTIPPLAAYWSDTDALLVESFSESGLEEEIEKLKFYFSKVLNVVMEHVDKVRVADFYSHVFG